MNRRDFLTFATIAASALAVPGRAMAAIDAPGLKEGEVFSRDKLLEYAKNLAKAAYVAPDATLPSSLQSLNYEQYVSIRFRPDRAIWSTDKGNFVIEPLHRGFIYASPVDLFTIEDGRVLVVPYEPGMFDFGAIAPPPADSKLGFSGFRLKSPIDVPDRMDDFAIFQGASYFRAIAKNQVYGAVARGLAVNTGEATGEEFPFFRAFWIERPQENASTLVVHALLDSEAATGAFRITLKPGEDTTIDVESTIYPRLKIDHVGIAPLNSMYLFGSNDHKGADDVRVAVHESSGLQMLSGGGEWIWRPLQNPETLQISAFVDKTPKGFGLLQRNRDPAAFEDMQHHYEAQPSVWIAPSADWGEGSVQLVEIPSDAEIHDNIIAYWRPKNPLEAGQEYAFAYRINWCWSPPDQPSMAVVRDTRIGAFGSKRHMFVVDFQGDLFANADNLKGVVPSITVAPGKTTDVSLTLDTQRRIGRLTFVLDPDAETYSEMRAVLTKDSKPVSETWLYRWTS
jgi:periplasmic glucans biosynthesis protein